MNDGRGTTSASGFVRPFVVTGGRTRPTLDLRVETQLVSIDDLAPDDVLDERTAVLELCQTPVSLAEVSARLDLPLGVARVVVADLVGDGLLRAHDASPGTGDSELLSRVLERLVAL